MSEPVKGIIHVHSDFSRDGLHSVAYLADFAREAGFGFVGLTDHAEDLSAEDMKDFHTDCKKHSDESLVMIPGLEFQCTKDIHILGIGITQNIAGTDSIEVASQIRAMGGVAVLAHPGRNGYQYPLELYSVINGIEIWNADQDGYLVPRKDSVILLKESRGINSGMLAFGGADLHWIDGPPGVVIEIQMNMSSRLSEWTVVDYLRSGRFLVRGKFVSFDAQGLRHRLVCFVLGALRSFCEVPKVIRRRGE